MTHIFLVVLVFPPFPYDILRIRCVPIVAVEVEQPPFLIEHDLVTILTVPSFDVFQIKKPPERHVMDDPPYQATGIRHFEGGIKGLQNSLIGQGPERPRTKIGIGHGL